MDAIKEEEYKALIEKARSKHIVGVGREVAAWYLKMSRSTFTRKQADGTGPIAVRHPNTHPFWTIEALDEWVNANPLMIASKMQVNVITELQLRLKIREQDEEIQRLKKLLESGVPQFRSLLDLHLPLEWVDTDNGIANSVYFLSAEAKRAAYANQMVVELSLLEALELHWVNVSEQRKWVTIAVDILASHEAKLIYRIDALEQRERLEKSLQ